MGDLPELAMDQAWVVDNTSGYRLLWQSSQCWKCPLVEQGNMSVVHRLDTRWRSRLAVADATGNLTCQLEEHLQQNGLYHLDFTPGTSGGDATCSLNLQNSPSDNRIPIYVALAVYLVLVLLYAGLRCFMSRRQQAKNAEDADESPTESSKSDTSGQKKKRLRSLDTFRGLSLVVMMFINFGGGGYWYFQHPPWNGITPADLVFPWFMFIMGTSMAFSFSSLEKKGVSSGNILVKIIKRTVVLFLIGMVLNTRCGYNDGERVRIPGVLQRFSLSYLLVATTVFLCRRPWADPKSGVAWLRDVLPYWPEWLVMAAVQAVFLGLTYALPVPGCPTGYVGPGGLHEGGLYTNCTGGAAGYIDKSVLGRDHIYGYPTPKVLYHTTEPYDPEGLLGVLPSVLCCYLGLQAGRIVLLYPRHRGRIIRLAVWAAVTGILTLILTHGKQNDGWIPLNKNLWSLSFVLCTASLAYLLLGLLYLMTDVKAWWRGQPFYYAGMNPIALYVLHMVFYGCFPASLRVFSHLLTDVATSHAFSLADALWSATFWTAGAYWMYCQDIFIAI